MSLFSQSIKEAIATFKALYRQKIQDASEQEAWIKAMGMKGRDLQCDDDVSLYLKALRLLDAVERPSEVDFTHPALQAFRAHLKSLLGNYYLDQNRVLHGRQQASRALVTGIQMMSYPADKLDERLAKRLEHVSALIVRFGSSEHLDRYRKALAVHQSKNRLFFMAQQNHLDHLIRQKRRQSR